LETGKEGNQPFFVVILNVVKNLSGQFAERSFSRGGFRMTTLLTIS